ncbi:MAG TPA: Gfo/Idh/MocA family oxidoreductase, partial [Gaiellaceae bacterium]|nr:Gfo/Idh/MocA family oxidoreductase [Gaiellaceae bacterium]
MGGDAVRDGVAAALVGGGFMGQVHAHALRAAGIPIVGVASSSRASAEAAAARLGIPRAYADVDELLADEAVTLVHVLTPNATHAALATAALDAGRHVVCEKPLATTAADATALASRASDAGLIAAVPFVYRFHPMVREVRERALDGRLGKLALIHGSYLQDWMLPRETANWRVDPAAGGESRAFADIGSHWIDLIEWVTGVQFVEAVGATSILFDERPTRDGGSA